MSSAGQRDEDDASGRAAVVTETAGVGGAQTGCGRVAARAPGACAESEPGQRGSGSAWRERL